VRTNKNQINKLTKEDVEKLSKSIRRQDDKSKKTPVAVALTQKCNKELSKHLKKQKETFGTTLGFTTGGLFGIKVYASKSVDKVLNTLKIDGMWLTKQQEKMFLKALILEEMLQSMEASKIK
jgi:hypothetical protein